MTNHPSPRSLLLRAADRCRRADELDHSGPHDAAEQELADEQLVQAARAYVAATVGQINPATPWLLHYHPAPWSVTGQAPGCSVVDADGGSLNVSAWRGNRALAELIADAVNAYAALAAVPEVLAAARDLLDAITATTTKLQPLPPVLDAAARLHVVLDGPPDARDRATQALRGQLGGDR